jgi:hypothetical protein
MAFHTAPRCTHIKITGHPCKSPALRGKNFCYFHERVIRGVATPCASRLDSMFILEGPESIQYAIMEIMNSLVLGRLEHKTASLLLRALNIAERNSRRARFHRRPSEMVQQLPNYGRQYLDEHPEYDPPEYDPAESPKPVHTVASPQTKPAPGIRCPSPARAKNPPQQIPWDTLHQAQASITRAQQGSLRDLKTCFQAIGLYPARTSRPSPTK